MNGAGVNCETVQSGNVVERYVLGQLSAEEQGSFEEHFFACDPCLEEVRLMQSLQAAAAGHPRPKVVATVPRRNWVAWSAIAAVLIAGFGLAVKQAPKAPRPKAIIAGTPPEILLLARVDPPRYTPSNLRSASADRDQQCRAAMTKYAEGDYAGAAAGLRGLDTAAARFYLGIADLMTGRVDDAVTELRGTEAMGETPYLEEARFFLAKALLAKQDAAGAARSLEQTIALAGDRKAEATGLLEQLRRLPARQ
jgi:hypothetical protein